MTTNVPAPTFGPIGFQAPLESQVLSGVQLDINAAFGGDVNPGLSTPQGQLATSMTAIIGQANSTFQFYTQQVDPAYAQGRMQDAIGRIYFINRVPALPTTLLVSCGGAGTTPIPIGAICVDPADNQWVCTGSGTIPVTGAIGLPFACATTGPIAIPGTLKIQQAIPGWDTATPISGNVGNFTESRSDFETRRGLSTAKNSMGSVPSVRGAVLGVNGLTDAFVTENVNDTPLTIGTGAAAVTLSAHSLFVSAIGGTDTDVATAIWTKKGPGCNYNGNTTILVTDPNPLFTPPGPQYAITFLRPPVLRFVVQVVIANSPSVPSTAATLIRNAVAAAFIGGDGGPRARMGTSIYALRFVAPIAALGPWAQPLQVALGTANAPSASIIGSITSSVLTVSSVLSGTVQPGQTLVDGSGVIMIGTHILAQLSGTVGGAGIYSIDVPQTVASETISLVAPSLSQVAIGIGQAPQLAAADVTVLVT